MPKRQKKTKQCDRIRNETNYINDDSGSEDNVPFPVAEPVQIESNEQEFLIDKLKDAINGATQKSAKGRKACLESIQNILSCKYFPHLIDVIVASRETITECIKSSLKRGNADEKSVAAILSVLTCIQLGPGSSSESIFTDLSPLLTTALNDNSLEFKTRSKCASALALIAFIVGEMEHATISSLMSTFESIFSESYFDNGAVLKHTLETTALHTSALAAWGVLLTLENNNNVSLMRLSELMKSSDVELRIVAGETTALLFELAREGENIMDGSIEFPG